MGGGMRFLGLTGNAYISDNEIRNNSLTSEKSQGAGIDVGLAEDKVFIRNNIIEYNHLSSSYASWGAGISFILDNELIVENNHITYNTTEATQFCPGAGLYSERASGLVEFRNNYLSYNTGTGSTLGGGIAYHNTFGNKVIFDGNVFEYNENRIGAGLWTYNSFDMVISNNVFRKNVANMNGGGLYMRFNPGNEMECAAVGLRGEAGVQQNEPVRIAGEHPLIINNTFVENEAVWGGGMFTEHQAEYPLIVNSIFWNNTANLGDEIYHTGTDSLLISYCDLDMTPDTAIRGKWRGNHNLFIDPGFCDTTCHIDESSPCVNAGIDSLLMDGVWYFAPDLDFEADERPYPSIYCDPVPDIGADEIEFDCNKIPLIIQNSKLKIQNYPNPFSNFTTIEFNLPEDLEVTLKLYDLTGRVIRSLVSGHLEQGQHTITLQSGELQSGIYILRLTANREPRTANCKLVVQ
jgi:hypothetical protein